MSSQLTAWPLFVAFSVALTGAVSGEPTAADRIQIVTLVDSNAGPYKRVSREIWGFAELGYHESKSSALLQDQLKKAGFSVQAGVADEPTGFTASYGSGKPVIAILGEFDALPGLSQQAIATREPGRPRCPRSRLWPQPSRRGCGFGHRRGQGLHGGTSRRRHSALLRHSG
ncbi:MAG: hypothetical protein ACYDBZ_18370 [Steroidobacteraceae bacterium]